MAEINLFEEYSTKIAERFKLASFTDRYADKNTYKFVGDKTLKILSTDTMPTADYQRSKDGNRFGPLKELGDTLQTCTIVPDKCFQFTLDKGNAVQQKRIKKANACMKREIDEVITPEIDMYRLKKWSDGAGIKKEEGAALDEKTILPALFSGGMAMSNKKVPRPNRVCFIRESIYYFCNLAPTLHGNEKSGGMALRDGRVPRIDGMRIIPVPDSYFPATVNFIIKHKGCTADPMQLQTYRILTEQAEVDGAICQGHYIYDSFVLDAQKEGLYVSTFAGLQESLQAAGIVTADTGKKAA